MITSLPSSLMPLLLTIAFSAGCPPSCICKWRNGKQTVECIGKGLSIIPKGIDTATQVLDVSGNKFEYIQGESFLRMDLINLQKLFLSHSGIKIIQVDALKGLSNLVELDLSQNMLETVPTEALINCPSLMKLNLSKNPISSLGRLAFNHLSFLTTLDVSGCEITEVHEDAFSGLYSLEWIDLTQNKIQWFPDMRLFPNRLKGVQLQENPWTCDCRIRSFNYWLKRDIVPILIPPVCREPRKFRGIPVRGLSESELACTPEVVPSSFYFELEEGRNISLLCQVKSIPPAKVSWIFEGKMLQNNSEPIPGFHLVYFIEEGAEEKESSLFIYNINSENNGTFYCVAENSAGVATANYTIMIILKPRPAKFEEDPDFPIDLISIFLATGLVLFSLCLVALIMALIKHHTKSRRRSEKEVKAESLKENIIPASTEVGIDTRKSILKNYDNRKTTLMTGFVATEDGDEQNHQLPEQNPDIINGIGSDGHSTSGILLEGSKSSFTASAVGLPGSTLTLIRPVPAVNPVILNQLPENRQRSHPYLKPTLTSKFRPVSAPTFERYVENFDLRSTADGYPVQRNKGMDTYNMRRLKDNTAFYSLTSSPNISLPKCKNNGNHVINVKSQTEVGQTLVFPDDVQL